MKIKFGTRNESRTYQYAKRGVGNSHRYLQYVGHVDFRNFLVVDQNVLEE